MGLVHKQGRDYFYASRWVDGRVLTTCYSGLDVEEIARKWADDRERAKERHLRSKVARAHVLANERDLDELAQESQFLVAATLEAAGWHRHDRGAWWKKRAGGGVMGLDHATNSTDATAESPDVERRVADRLRLAASSDGEAARYFDDPTRAAPAGFDLLIKIHSGDLVAVNENSMLLRIEAKNRLRREAIRRDLACLRDDLAGPGPVSAIERLLIERIVAAWLAMQYAEQWSILVLELDMEKPGISVFEQKHLDRAEKRLVGLLKDLDLIRRKVAPGHRLYVQAKGDVRINAPGDPDVAIPGPPMIDLTPEPEVTQP